VFVIIKTQPSLQERVLLHILSPKNTITSPTNPKKIEVYA